MFILMCSQQILANSTITVENLLHLAKTNRQINFCRQFMQFWHLSTLVEGFLSSYWIYKYFFKIQIQGTHCTKNKQRSSINWSCILTFLEGKCHDWTLIVSSMFEPRPGIRVNWLLESLSWRNLAKEWRTKPTKDLYWSLKSSYKLRITRSKEFSRLYIMKQPSTFWSVQG